MSTDKGNVTDQIAKTTRANSVSPAFEDANKHEDYFNAWQVAETLRSFAANGEVPTETLRHLTASNIEVVRTHLLDDVKRLKESEAALALLSEHAPSV